MDPSRPAEPFRLDRATCLTLLKTQHVGRLVNTAESIVRVVNYTVRGDTIVLRSDPRLPIETIIDAPVVFEVDMFDERTRSGWSVDVRGTARDVTATSAGADRTPADGDNRAPGPKNRWIAVTVEDVSGRLLRGQVRPTRVHPQAYL